MSEQSRFPRSVLGRVFPEGFVAGLMESSSQAGRVLEALSRAGIERGDVRVLPGLWALEIDASSHPSLAVAPVAPGEAAVSQEFLAGALLGDVLVGIRAWSDVGFQAVAGVLVQEGVGCVRHFGTGFVRTPQELAGTSS